MLFSTRVFKSDSCVSSDIELRPSFTHVTCVPYIALVRTKFPGFKSPLNDTLRCWIIKPPGLFFYCKNYTHTMDSWMPSPKLTNATLLKPLLLRFYLRWFQFDSWPNVNEGKTFLFRRRALLMFYCKSMCCRFLQKMYRAVLLKWEFFIKMRVAESRPSFDIEESWLSSFWVKMISYFITWSSKSLKSLSFRNLGPFLLLHFLFSKGGRRE